MNHQNTVVLIPSLEPDDRLPRYVGDLLAAGFGTVVVVDDGSSAAYQPIFDGMAQQNGCVVLHHDVNRGKGVALKTGYAWIKEHRADCTGVITADADGQHAVKDCLHLSELLAEGKRALYLGSRDFNLPHVPKKSRHGNHITSAVFSAFYGVYLPDTQTGLRAFRREELDFMLGVDGERYEYEMKVLIAASRDKLPMVPVTIETIYENNNEGSHFHPLRDSWRIYKVILGEFLRYIASSLICFFIDYGLANLLAYELLPLIGMQPGDGVITASGYLARLVSSVVNFSINRAFVFQLKSGTKQAAIRYALLCVVIITLSNLGVMALEFIRLPYWLAKLLCDTALYFLSYRVQRSWVFQEGKHA